ncbi:MAG: hypothetical protein ONB44_22330 [candidate division KSB1 bacterium]|nr:hypothetical protein [candidate division KSB1 bacterium]
MKTKKKWFFYLLMGFCLISRVEIRGQDTQGGKAWEEVRLAEQIPEATLSAMSTEELIQAYLNTRYPGYLLAYNNVQDAFEHACNEFNGLRELLEREDAPQKLIELYRRMDPAAYEPDWQPVKKGSFTFSFVFVEALLAHESIQKKLTRSQVRTLLTELLKKNEYKTRHPEIYSIIGVQFNAYSIARLLESKGGESRISQALSQSPGVRHLLKTGRLQNSDVLSIVIQKAQEFLKMY